MKKFYKIFLWSIIIVAIPNLIFGTWYTIDHDNHTLKTITDIITIPEVILFFASIIILVKIMRLKWPKIYRVLPTYYISFILLLILAGMMAGFLGFDGSIFDDNVTLRWTITILAILSYIFEMYFSFLLLKKNLPNLSVKNGDFLKIKSNQSGVAGWLAFFVFTLFVSIFLNFIFGVKDVFDVLRDTDYTIDEKIWLVPLDILYFTSIIILIISTIYSILKTKAQAIYLAKATLFVLFISNFLIAVILTISGIGDPDSSSGASLSYIRALGYPLLWFLYLKFSKRVKNTFPPGFRKPNLGSRVLFFASLALITSFFAGAFINALDSEEANYDESYSYDALPEWQEFNSIDNNFKITFPWPPEQDSGITNFPDFARLLEYDIYLSYGGNDDPYVVYVVDYPADLGYGDNKKDMEVMYNAIFGDPAYVLLDSGYDKFKDRDSFFYTIKNEEENYYSRGRIIMDGKTVYSLSVSYDEGLFDQYSYDKFINSFSPGVNLENGADPNVDGDLSFR